MKMRLLFLVFCFVICGAEKLHNLRYYELINVAADAISSVLEDEERTRDTESHPYKRRLTFDGHGRRFDLHLKRSDVIPKKLNVITQNHEDVGNSYHFQDHEVENCYYHGRLGVEEDAPLGGSISACDEAGFRGRITLDDGEEFMLRPLEKDDLVDMDRRTKGAHVLYNSKDVLIKEDRPKKDAHKTFTHGANKLNVKYDSYKIYGRDDERTIEVVPVVDHEMYVIMDRDIPTVVKQVIWWMHDGDHSYQMLDKKTHMVTVGLVVWDKRNEAHKGIKSMPVYAEKVMWEKLGLRFDTACLLFNGLTGWGMTHGVGHVCRRSSAAIVSASTFYQIGGLIYHETLHGLGLHEEEMGKTTLKPNFNKLIDRNAFPCLYKRIAKEFKENTCGNGVKEAGEVCDCVNEYECKKRGEFECCDPKTCQLRTNMQCMNGGCCKKCMFKKSGAACIATDKCLSPSSSTCSGTSEKCLASSGTASSPSLPAQKIGCYRLKHNGGNHVLFNGHNITYKKHHNEYDEYMKGVLCECARAAREAEREYFAIKFNHCFAVSKDDLLSNEETGKSQVQKINIPVVKSQGAPVVVQLHLKNAEQSSTHTSSGCSGVRTCVAEKAIDGNMGTSAATQVDRPTWWMAQLSNRSKIEDISITTNSWAFGAGYFDRLKIKTADSADGPWSVCISEFKMTAPFVDHVIKCVNPTVANFIKIEVHGGVPLYLKEVKVRGYHFAGKRTPVVQLRLKNAEQSTTHTSSRCSGVRTCAAEKAIDGNMGTTTATHISRPTWWMAQLSNRSKIEDISITTNGWAFRKGFFDRLKIKTAESADGPWSVCRSEFKMTAPFVDHVIKCVNVLQTVANFIKIEVHGGVPLYLKEVKVRGYHFAGKLPKIPKTPCNGKDHDCCTEYSPCAEGDGDCDRDSHCEGNLVCGSNNCPKRSPFNEGDDCCMKAHCNLASKVNKDKLICNKANYKNNNPNACTSEFKDIFFVYKVDIPNINRCPSKNINEIGAKLPTKKGCHILKGSSSPSLLVDNSGYYQPDEEPSAWSLWTKRLLCECAKIAKTRGGKFVGLQDNKCYMIDEADLGSESNDKCFLADGWWTREKWYRYKCSKNNLHNNSPYPCVGSVHSRNSYFVYQL